MAGFRAMLAGRQVQAGTVVCVGLDPLEEKMPAVIRDGRCSTAEKFEIWMCGIADATAPSASMFKPQSAHWEAVPGGAEALRRTTEHIHKQHPGIPVFWDCKRGDIARTQKQYARAHLITGGADGMNFSPYMGRDCMAALAFPETAGKALVGLCYTSNPDARRVQDVRLEDGRPYWEFIAEETLCWTRDLKVVQDAGLVMAAAYENPKGSGIVYSQHLVRCREIVGNELWFLIPGIGTQGGFVAETVRAAYFGPGSIAINSSSDIIFASAGTDYAEAAAAKAKALRDQINAAITA